MLSLDSVIYYEKQKRNSRVLYVNPGVDAFKSGMNQTCSFDSHGLNALFIKQKSGRGILLNT